MTPTPLEAPTSTRHRKRSVTICDTTWRTYSKLLKAFADRPAVKLIFDRGRLTIMAPSLEHDNDGRFLGVFVGEFALGFGVPYRPGGAVTLRRRDLQRGIEGDEVFWLASAPAMAGVRVLDLQIHPPPDLAIEVDVTRSSVNKAGVYAALGVPELWRLDGDRLTFLALTAGGMYAGIPQSLSFPLVTPADVMPFLDEMRTQTGDISAVVFAVREWVRRRAAAPTAGE